MLGSETEEDDMEHTPLLGAVDRAGRALRLDEHLAATPAQVWAALTQPGELTAWLGRVQDGSPGPGTRFALWHDETTCSHHAVTSWQPERLLGLTWDFPDEAESALRFELESSGPGTRLTVVHEDLADPVAYAAGWHRHLEYLAAHVSGADRPFEDFWDGYETLVERYGSA